MASLTDVGRCTCRVKVINHITGSETTIESQRDPLSLFF